MGDERAAVYGMQPGSSSVYQLALLETLIPPGTKKVPKLYTAACHPVLPHIVAVASNTGTAPSLPPSPICSDPAASLNAAKCSCVSGYDPQKSKPQVLQHSVSMAPMQLQNAVGRVASAFLRRHASRRMRNDVLIAVLLIADGFTTSAQEWRCCRSTSTTASRFSGSPCSALDRPATRTRTAKRPTARFSETLAGCLSQQVPRPRWARPARLLSTVRLYLSAHT